MEYKVVKLPIKDEYEPMVLCIGNFDGVHLGHKKLIEKTLELSKKHGIKSAFFTLNPNPRKVFNKDRIFQLTSIDDRKEITSNFGINSFLEFEFNNEFMNLTPSEFIETVLLKLNVKHVVCGFDYTFGKKGAGKVEDLIILSEGRYEVHVVDEVVIDDEKVSTTRIMKELTSGSLEEANKLLGRNYSVTGVVQKGLGNGHKIGFPTANIETFDYLLPKNGVYAVKVEFEGKNYYGMANVGLHPTISKLKKPLLEVHLFEFEGNLYEKGLKIEFLAFLREEIEFSGLEDLKTRIKLDTFLIFELISRA